LRLGGGLLLERYDVFEVHVVLHRDAVRNTLPEPDRASFADNGL
jgi:hypothetical protein